MQQYGGGIFATLRTPSVAWRGRITPGAGFSGRNRQLGRGLASNSARHWTGIRCWDRRVFRALLGDGDDRR